MVALAVISGIGGRKRMRACGDIGIGGRKRMIGLAVISGIGGRKRMIGLAVISGIGGLQGVIGLPITSLRGGCGGVMGFAVSYLRGGCVGVVRLVVFSLRGGGVGVNGTCRVVPTRRSRRRSRACDVHPCAEVASAWRRACGIVGARRRSRHGGVGLAVLYLRGGCVGVVRLVVFSLRGSGVGVIGTRGVVPTWRLCRCDGTRGVVPTRRSCWWGWACDNIVTRCRCAVHVEHSRVTRQWRLGRSWDLRVSRQQNQQEQN